MKLNMAIHLSWILKSRKQDIPANLRVQIVQLFQKPPSIGFCHSICKSVNPIMVGDMKEENTQLSYFAKFFDRNESSLSRLIEIRNAEAHGTIKFEKDIHDEIRGHMQILIMQPLFTSACLIISGFEDMLKAGFDHPKGIEQSDYQFILLKEEVFIEDEYSVLNGTELCLFPFAVSNEKADICLWNQRSGKKGTYTSYLSDTVNKIEVTGITEFAGFPYDDWKRSANPIYVNYLTCRNKVQEELIDDEKIGIEEWHNEILHAFRLEKDLNLDKNEWIGYKTYVSGILQKLSKIEDDDIKLNYHRKIFDLKDKLDDFNDSDRGYLIQEIFKSCTFLLWNAIDENKRDKFNYFYKEGLALIPTRFYITGFLYDDVLVKFCGGDKHLSKIKSERIFFILKIIFVIGLPISILFYFLNGLVIWVIVIIYLIFLIKLNQKIVNNYFEFLNNDRIYKKKSIQKALFSLSKSFYLNISVKLNLDAVGTKNYKLETEYREIISVSENLSKVFKEEQKVSNFFIPKTYSDFQKINIKSQEITFEVMELNSENVLYSFVDITNEDWLRYKQLQINSSSVEQLRYMQKGLNNIVYHRNFKILNNFFVNNKSKKYEIKPDFETHFWDDSNEQELQWLNHNYLLGWCFAATNDLINSEKCYRKAAFEGKGPLAYFALYNLSQIYGAKNLVNEYYTNYIIFNTRLENEVDTVIDKLSPQMISNVKHELKGMEKHFNEITGMKLSEGSLRKHPLIWSSSKEFEFLGRLTKMNSNIQITLKYTHENGR